MTENFILKSDTNLGRSITNPQHALRFEWLETNGLGGHASSTPYLCHSRKYHGLLVLPLAEYGSKYVLLSKYDSTLTIGKRSWRLSTSKFPGVYHPTGHKFITQFSYENGIPNVHLNLGDVKICKSILMAEGYEGVLVRYRILESDHPCTLSLSPLLPYREFNTLQKMNMAVNPACHLKGNHWETQPYEGMPSMYFTANTPLNFFPAPDWYENFEYLREQARGYDYLEDISTPGVFEVRLKAGEHLTLFASIEQYDLPPDSIWEQEEHRRQAQEKSLRRALPKPLKDDAGYRTLCQNARKFVILPARSGKPSIIAGFPWFGEWGRDSMIAAAGITLYSGESKELFFDILDTYVSATQGALIANQFNINGNSSYNSADASLLFFWALQQYTQHSTGSPLIKKGVKRTKALAAIGERFEPVLLSIIQAFLDSSVEHVRCEDDGFLSVGSAMTQLTWMDALVDGVPVTPRHGKAIDLNALWYNALQLYCEVLKAMKKEKESPQKTIVSRIVPILKSIGERFEQHYLTEEGYLCDTIIDGQQVLENRPNQLFALAIPYPLLQPESAVRVFERIWQDLYTPVGLRTLSPSHKSYAGVYSGDQKTRDSRYHQGSVWPFLTGIYANAFINVSQHDPSKDKKELQAELLGNVGEMLYNRGIASLSELYDGNLPHKGRGCPFQAWSVGECIRAIQILGEK